MGGWAGPGAWDGGSAKGNSKEEEELQSTHPCARLEYQIHHKRSGRERYPCGSQESKTLDGATEEK